MKSKIKKIHNPKKKSKEWIESQEKFRKEYFAYLNEPNKQTRHNTVLFGISK